MHGNPIRFTIIFIGISIVVFGIFSTLNFSYKEKENLHIKSQNIFEDEVNLLTNSLKLHLKAYTLALQSVQSYHQSKEGNVTSEQHIEYIKTLKLNEKTLGLGGIGYAIEVNESEKKEYEDQFNMAINPSIEKERYIPIIYAVSASKNGKTQKSKNSKIPGFDISFEENRLNAINQARDTNVITMSKSVDLITGAVGSLVILPIYSNNTDLNTVQKRRDSVIGYIVSTFTIESLMNDFLKNTPLTKDLYIYITDSEGRKVYTTTTKSFDTQFKKVVPFEIAGKKWNIHIETKNDFALTYEEKALPNRIVIFGLTASLLATIIIFMSILTNFRAHAIATKKTKDLNKYKQAIELIPTQISILNPYGKIQFINSHSEKVSGYTPDEIIGKKLDLWVKPKKKNYFKNLWNKLRENNIFVCNHHCIKKNGKKYYAELNIRPLKDKKGKLIGYICIERDISQERKEKKYIKEKNEELTKLNNLLVGRELKMIELKNKLKNKKT